MKIPVENKKNSRLVDALLVLLIILPLALALTLKICTTPDAPLEDGVVISGAQVYFTIPMPLQEWPITAAQVNSWAVILSILGVCLYLTHGIKVIPDSKRQLAAEWIVDTVNKLVKSNMGEQFMDFAPFVAGILALSALSSLSSLLGLFAPTSDLNIVLGWAILVFILITHYKLKGGLWNYIKGFFSPIPVFAPLNIIGEVA
ncbi:MAG: F0F1 ATP synthase subunit A, partial [Clostridia bacterium]|nr:F0F1 ATP synthase subunit A [Clostridia bacterium]